MLLEMDIVHFDLKDNNIMYDQRYYVPIIIDFGLTCKMPLTFDKSSQFFQIYDKYLIWPIEVFIISQIYKKPSSEILTKETTDQLINTCMTNIDHPEGIYQKITFFDATEIETYKTGIRTFLESYTGYSYNNLYDKLMEMYKTWDMYSLCATFLLLIHMYFKDQATTPSTPSTPNLLKPYMDIFKIPIFAIPPDRESIQEIEFKIRKINIKKNHLDPNI